MCGVGGWGTQTVRGKDRAQGASTLTNRVPPKVGRDEADPCFPLRGCGDSHACAGVCRPCLYERSLLEWWVDLAVEPLNLQQHVAIVVALVDDVERTGHGHL